MRRFTRLKRTTFKRCFSSREHELIRRASDLEHQVETLEHDVSEVDKKLDEAIENLYEAIDNQAANGKLMLACVTLGGIMGLSFGLHCPYR